jgi:hypothetical protein
MTTRQLQAVAQGKPHIRMVSGSWQCAGFGYKGALSKTPKVAYSHWRFVAMPRLRN